MTPLEELRQRLGITGGGREDTSPKSSTVPTSLSQGIPSGVPLEKNAGCASSSVLDNFTAKQAQHKAEMERLYAGGDDADGLEEIRRAFRRAGRG